MKKYIPYILALLFFFAGRLTVNDKPSKELIQKFDQERKRDHQVIAENLVEIQLLTRAQEKVEQLRVQDSIHYAGKLSENKRAYAALKKKYNEINLNRANAHTLDSLVSVLYAD